MMAGVDQFPHAPVNPKNPVAQGLTTRTLCQKQDESNPVGMHAMLGVEKREQDVPCHTIDHQLKRILSTACAHEFDGYGRFQVGSALS